MPYIRAVLGGVASAVDTFTSLPGWLQTSGIMGAILFGKIRVLMIGAVLVNEVIKKVTDGVDLLRRAGELVDDIAAELGIDTRGDRLRVDTSGLRSAASNMSALGDELATFAPAPLNPCAITRPIPLDPPITSTYLSWKSRRVIAPSA